MTKRILVALAASGLAAVVLGQQSPPIQPKTVDTPKLTPLQLPPPPKNGDVVANAPLTASEAVKIAIAHQPAVAISKAAADALHGQTIQTRSQLYPTVDASASRTQAQTFKSGTTGQILGGQSNTQASVVLNQLIFDFQKTRDMVNQSMASERAGYRNYDQTLEDAALTAKQDFYAYVQATQQTKVQEANVTSRQAQVDLTQAQVNAGTGEPGDLVNAKTLAAQGTLLWSQAQLAEANAKLKLTTDMGIDPRTPIVLADSSEADVTLPLDANSLVDDALKQRPSIKAAEETLLAAGYGVSVARKTTVPSLNFGAGFATQGNTNPFDAQDGYISLTLSWTLIDGGLQTGKVITAKANRTSAAESLRQTSLIVVQEVSSALVGVQAARQQIGVANAEVTNAQEGERIALGSYRAGVSTFQAVITAQAALVQAETDQVNAVAGLNNAFATLDHAIGKWPL